MVIFIWKGVKYKINDAQKIEYIGDFNERSNTVFIDKEIPKEFQEGIAVHEIVERSYVKKGHTYAFSHEKAQEQELAFYKKRYGQKANAIFKKEEETVLKLAKQRTPKRMRPKHLPLPKLEEESPSLIKFEGKKYQIEHNHQLTRAIVDIDENKQIIYIDKSIQEKYMEGLALWQLEERKGLHQGLSYTEADARAEIEEDEWYTARYGRQEAKELIQEEIKLTQNHLAKEEKAVEKGRPILNKNTSLA